MNEDNQNYKFDEEIKHELTLEDYFDKTERQREEEVAEAGPANRAQDNMVRSDEYLFQINDTQIRHQQNGANVEEENNEEIAEVIVDEMIEEMADELVDGMAEENDEEIVERDFDLNLPLNINLDDLGSSKNDGNVFYSDDYLEGREIGFKKDTPEIDPPVAIHYFILLEVLRKMAVLYRSRCRKSGKGPKPSIKVCDLPNLLSSFIGFYTITSYLARSLIIIEKEKQFNSKLVHSLLDNCLITLRSTSFFKANCQGIFSLLSEKVKSKHQNDRNYMREFDEAIQDLQNNLNLPSYDDLKSATDDLWSMIEEYQQLVGYKLIKFD